MLLGVDVGGTFTDAVLVVDGEVVAAKAPTTPEDQSRGVLDAVRVALERAGRDAAEVSEFAIDGTAEVVHRCLPGTALSGGGPLPWPGAEVFAARVETRTSCLLTSR
jgi:predicted NBD/HSP70 family sugar kinase